MHLATKIPIMGMPGKRRDSSSWATLKCLPLFSTSSTIAMFGCGGVADRPMFVAVAAWVDADLTRLDLQVRDQLADRPSDPHLAESARNHRRRECVSQNA